MTARNGHSGRTQYLTLRSIGMAALLMLGLGTLTTPRAEGGPIRGTRAGLRTQAWISPRAAALPRLSRSSLPGISWRRNALVSPAAGGPMANYYRWALRTQTLRVNIPPTLRSLRPQSNGRLPDWAFVDYLQWRRSLNPARFDFYHPNIGPMLVCREWPDPICPPPDPPVSPQVVPPPTRPPAIPEPSSALVMTVLLGSGWWARRWRSRQRRTSLQEEDSGGVRQTF